MTKPAQVSMLRRIFERVREECGLHPAGLHQALTSYPELRTQLDTATPNICADSVPRWHELGEYPPLSWPSRQRGLLRGWHASAGRWQSFQLIREEYAQIALCEIDNDWRCDVTDIDGFGASKADLHAFAHTDAMAEARCQALITEVSPERLEKCLSHKEIRIIHSPRTTSDHFTRYLWDGRLWLMNDGGSHHTAAAKYLASRLDLRVPLKGRLYTYSINAPAVAALRRDFEMFVIGRNHAEGAQAFFEAMRAFRATWLWHPLPRPYEGAKAVLLPRSEARSMRVAAAMRDARIFDLGEYLTILCARQQITPRSALPERA